MTALRKLFGLPRSCGGKKKKIQGELTVEDLL